MKFMESLIYIELYLFKSADEKKNYIQAFSN